MTAQTNTGTDCFTENELEQLAKALADAATGPELTALLRDARLSDPQNDQTLSAVFKPWSKPSERLTEAGRRNI